VLGIQNGAFELMSDKHIMAKDTAGILLGDLNNMRSLSDFSWSDQADANNRINC
jgi:hypothetical protein